MNEPSDGNRGDDFPEKSASDRRPPPTRIPADPWDAEVLVAEWMHWAGFSKTRLTSGGADGGIDVVSRHAVAQVKYTSSAVSRPKIQQLDGIAARAGKQALFFSKAGYSRAAAEWANEARMALFVFDGDAIRAFNLHAQEVMDEASGTAPLHLQRSTRRQIGVLAGWVLTPGIIAGIIGGGGQSFQFGALLGFGITGGIIGLFVQAIRTLAQQR